MDKNTIKIEKFLLRKYKCFQEIYKTRLYKQLSDHYGISVIIKYDDNSLNEENMKIVRELNDEYKDDYTSNTIIGLNFEEDNKYYNEENKFSNFELEGDDEIRKLV